MIEYIELFIKGIAFLLLGGFALVLTAVAFFAAAVLFTKWDENRK